MEQFERDFDISVFFLYRKHVFNIEYLHRRLPGDRSFSERSTMYANNTFSCPHRAVKLVMYRRTPLEYRIHTIAPYDRRDLQNRRAQSFSW